MTERAADIYQWLPRGWWGQQQGLIVDLFAGGGGASTGIEAATGRDVSIAINHSKVALAVHKANHPRTLHLASDIWEIDPLQAIQGIPIDLLWASPDCTHFSVAKGGQPRKQNIRSLADVVIRWGALPKPLRPKIIFLENVPEFEGWGPLDDEGQPIKLLKGSFFKRWKGELEALGYTVGWRTIIASHFGAPTSRKRLFLVARCDGLPIVFPDATHGPGLLPFHTAAECIDWSLPCPSIFGRARPLKPKTLARIAEGIKRFVLESASPFIVEVNHGGVGRNEMRVHSLDKPLNTITAAQRGQAVVAPVMIAKGFGEREGQRPRAQDPRAPMTTVVAQGTKQALVAALLSAHYGGQVGTPLDRPIRTITAQDHHSLTAVELGPAEAAGGEQVRAFLAAYYGADAAGQGLDEPVRTITTRDRFGLVTVHGLPIIDIGMRMLQPHELLRGQFGRFAQGYDMSEAKAETGKWSKTAAVRLIGNSVCPEAAEAIVRANLPERMRAAA